MLEIRDLHKTYPCGAKALRGVGLTIKKGESLGLVGESGCGKSTLGKVILRLEEPEQGQLVLQGLDYTHLKGERLRQLRLKLQIVFQDSSASLNPRKTVASSLAEPLENFYHLGKEEKKRKVLELLEMVGLEESQGLRYPHQLSGGQRQRIVIARALALKPQWLICDEPVSSLDPLIQESILELLQKLKRELGLSYLFISHDLAVVAKMSERMAVMYAGKIVEVVATDKLLTRIRHPYTAALLNSLPSLQSRGLKNFAVRGEPPNPSRLPSGCSFHTRCLRAETICCQLEPPLIGDECSALACHFPFTADS